MNKYIIVIIVLVLIIGGGATYRAYFVPDIDKALVTGEELFATITIHEDTWSFDPEFIEADQGDKLNLTIINKDNYDHGFAMDAFGISQRIPALEIIAIDFVVTKSGEFPYYCSVSCSSGIVDGVKRGHFDQIGKLSVRSAISETSGLAPTVSDEDIAKQTRISAMKKEIVSEFAKNGTVLIEDDVMFDEGNTNWNAREIVLSELEGLEYQVLYIDIQVGSSAGINVFIDTTTGKIIAILEDE